MQRVKLKTSIIAALILLLLFGIWNVIWLVLTNNRYDAFLKAVPESRFGNHILKKDGYVYNVKKPGYLSFTGNLGVNHSEQGNALIIWPKMDGGYEYGVRIIKGNAAHEIYLNEKMQPIDQGNQQAIQLVKELESEIEELFNKANSIWDLE